MDDVKHEYGEIIWYEGTKPISLPDQEVKSETLKGAVYEQKDTETSDSPD